MRTVFQSFWNNLQFIDKFIYGFYGIMIKPENDLSSVIELLLRHEQLIVRNDTIIGPVLLINKPWKGLIIPRLHSYRKRNFSKRNGTVKQGEKIVSLSLKTGNGFVFRYCSRAAPTVHGGQFLI